MLRNFPPHATSSTARPRSSFSPPDVTESDFTELAENVFRVALGQTSGDATTRDFTDEECETAVAAN